MKTLKQLSAGILLMGLFVFTGCSDFNFDDWIGKYMDTDTVGTTKWTYQVPEGYTSFGTLALDHSGNVVAAIGGGTGTWKPAKLICLDPEGNFLWESIELDHAGASSPVIGADGTIYVSGFYKLYAFDGDGTKKWEHDFPLAQIGQPKVSPDGTIFVHYVGSGEYLRRLFALNPDGTVKWATDEHVSHFCDGLTVHPNGFLVFFDRSYEDPWTPAYNIIARDISDGHVVWAYPLEAGYNDTQDGYAISTDGKIYIPFFKNVNTGLNSLLVLEADGTLFKLIGLHDSYHSGIPCISSDGILYHTNTNRGLEAISTDGQILWEHTMLGGQMLALDKKGNMYLNSASGLQVISSAGELKNDLKIATNSQSPAISGTGVVYVISEGFPAVITAVKGYAGLAQGWPRSYGNNQNTGSR